MEITGLISAILVGLVIGALARLVLPGRQRVGVLWTIGVGIVAALIGSASRRASASATPTASTGSS